MNKLRTLALLFGCVCFSSCTKMDRLAGYNITVNHDGKCDSYKINIGEKITIEPVTKENFSFLGYYYSDTQITDSQGNMLEPFNFDFSLELTPKFEGKKLSVYCFDSTGSVKESFQIKFYDPMPDIFTGKDFNQEFVGYKCGEIVVSDKNGYFPGYETLNENYQLNKTGQVELIPIYNSSSLKNIKYTYTLDGGKTFITEKVRTTKNLLQILPKNESDNVFLWAKKDSYFLADLLNPYDYNVYDDIELTAIGHSITYNGYDAFVSFDGKKEFYFYGLTDSGAVIEPMPGIDELYFYGRNQTTKASIRIPELDHSITTYIEGAKFTQVNYLYDDSSCKDDIQNTLNIYKDVSFIGTEKIPNYPAINCKNLKLNIFEESSLTINANSGSLGEDGGKGTSSHHDGYQGGQGTTAADGIRVIKGLVINNKGTLTVVGGVGGKGGTGGKGYDSYTGFLDIGSYSAGNGGKGGTGGKGGNGIVFETDAVFEIEEGLENIVFSGGNGGLGGNGGPGGAASSSVFISHPAGQPGAGGDLGNTGKKYVGSQGEILDVWR